MVCSTCLLRRCCSFTNQIPRSNRSKLTGQMELCGIVGIGAGSLTDNDVIQVDILLDGTSAAHTDDVFHIKEVEQLVGINADCRHTHTGSHDRNLHALIVTGVTIDTADVVHQNRVLQEVLCNKLGTQRITRHQNSLTEADLVLNIDMGCNREISHR